MINNDKSESITGPLDPCRSSPDGEEFHRHNSHHRCPSATLRPAKHAMLLTEITFLRVTGSWVLDWGENNPSRKNMLRKPVILLPSYWAIPKNRHSHVSPRNGDLRSYQRRQGKDPTRRSQSYTHYQSYSQVPGDERDLPWPWPSSTATLPTPYEILRLKKGTPYSKNVFYELVKIYHPDRHVHGETSKRQGLSHAVKLERYRLIVAANDILSDPAKRHAYDRCGAGWDRFEDSYSCTYNRSRNSRWSGFEDNGSVFRNATWEDWEKWHQRNDHPRPEPTSLGNRSFFSLVAFVAALAMVSQLSKAGQASQTFLDQMGARHNTSSKNLQESRFGYHGGFPNKDQRIRKFLSTREQYDPGVFDAPVDDISSSPISRPETR